MNTLPLPAPLSPASEKIEPDQQKEELIMTEPGVERVDQVAVAISALTAAARGRRVVGAGTPDEHTEPIDAAELICSVVASVAANLGGADELLSGRPGSWEAGYVRQIVDSTAGNDERELLRWRTEPVRLEFDAEDVFSDMGIYELYDEEFADASEVYEAARVAVFEATATADELARAHELEAALHGVLGKNEEEMAEVTARFQEYDDLYAAVWKRAEAAGGDLLESVAAAQRLSDQINQLWEADKAAYRDAYADAARQMLTDRGLGHLAVELVDAEAGDPWVWDELTEELQEHVRRNAVLPMTGQAPDWTDGRPADALRRAGQTYTGRAAAANAA